MKRTVAAFPGLSVFYWWTGFPRQGAFSPRVRSLRLRAHMFFGYQM